MKNLSLTVQKLRKKTVAKTSSKDEIIHQQSFTWKEVIAEANDATDRYKKTLFGKICERSGAFEHWLTLLPSDSYAAAISGAFTISIQV